MRDKVHLVGSRSYLTYSQGDLTEKLNGNPYSFLHIIRPELDTDFRELPREARFNRVREEYERFVGEGIFQREEEAALYIYRQSSERHSSLGIVGSVPVQDYENGRIKRHENTLERREALFAQYLNATRFNAEPVLLVHDEIAGMDACMQELTASRPEYEFTTTDEVLHELWIISEPKQLSALTELMAQLPAMYIADGHHRTSSSALLAERLGGNGQEAWHELMVFCLPASQIQIEPFHRIVRDLHGMSRKVFLHALEQEFGVEEVIPGGYPKEKGEVHVYLPGHWYRFYLKASENSSWTSTLDAQRLNDQLLRPLLEIGDLRSDRRISFRGGDRSVRQMMDEVDSGKFAAAFALTSVSYQELKGVSDEGGVMPPKSTYVEPKLRSGITIFELGKQDA